MLWHYMFKFVGWHECILQYLFKLNYKFALIWSIIFVGFGSISCISYCEGWSIYTLQMFCTEIWNQATCYWMQTVTSRFVTLGLHEPHQRQISWQNMLWPDGIEPLNCYLTAQNILLPLISGQLVAFWWRSLEESHFFLVKTMFSSWC